MDVNNPADIAKKRKLMMDLIIKEGDYKKIEQKKNQLEFEMNDIKKKIGTMNMQIDANKKAIDRINSDQVIMSAEIKRVKKEMNEM